MESLRGPATESSCWTAAARSRLGQSISGHDEIVGAQNLTTEVCGIKRNSPDRLIDAAQFTQRERFGHERGGQGGVLKFRAGSLDRIRNNPVMVVGQSRTVVGSDGGDVNKTGGTVGGWIVE